MLRILLAGDTPDRLLDLRRAVGRMDCEVVAEVIGPRRLVPEIARLAPDAMVIDTGALDQELSNDLRRPAAKAPSVWPCRL